MCLAPSLRLSSVGPAAANSTKPVNYSVANVKMSPISLGSCCRALGCCLTCHWMALGTERGKAHGSCDRIRIWTTPRKIWTSPCAAWRSSWQHRAATTEVCRKQWQDVPVAFECNRCWNWGMQRRWAGVFEWIFWWEWVRELAQKWNNPAPCRSICSRVGCAASIPKSIWWWYLSPVRRMWSH